MRTGLFVLAVLGFSTSAFAGESYVYCMSKESDKQCIQRAVKNSDAMNQNFYTGKASERPMIFNAIYSTNPTTVLLQTTGEGGSVFEQYLLIYPVDGTDGSGMKAAAFSATIEKSLEDTGKKPKVVARAVELSSIKSLTGASESND